VWLTGGVFHEHTHRLWASGVGILVVVLMRWLGGCKSRWPLIVIGLVELFGGLGLLQLGAAWRGAGGFLSGIGGVVLLSGVVWFNNERAARPLPALGWAAFWLVQLQGLLGGLRVVLDSIVLGNLRMGTVFGIFHGCLAQAFLALLGVIALFTSRWWCERRKIPSAHPMATDRLVGRLFLVATILIFLQLTIGATMRHQHAGLAIPDFPLAFGKIWPDLSAEAVARYNQHRMEITTANSITSFQIGLQLVHRLLALAILILVTGLAWRAYRSPVETSYRRLAFAWVALILLQVGLGAWTIWSNKAADVATAHVLVGALSLVTGVAGCIISIRRRAGSPESAFAPDSEDLRREAPVSAGTNP
jgi:heme a synthase